LAGQTGDSFALTSNKQLAAYNTGTLKSH